jgi:hypothetical protein
MRTAIVILMLVGIALVTSSSDEYETNSQAMMSLYFSQGISAYCRAFGEFPESWDRVVDAGLVQIEMTSFDGTPVDPDDGVMNFPGDYYYMPPTENDGPRIAFMDANTESQIKVLDIYPPITYEEYFSVLSLSDGETATLHSALSDDRQVAVFAIVGLCRTGLQHYKHKYGEFPRSWQEFINSGFAPVDNHSVNPLTGRPFAGDGSNGDLLYTTGELNGQLYVSLQPVDMDGTTFPPLDY